MNELSIAAKFLYTVAAAALILGATGSLCRSTYRMAEYAVEAQQHDQMSYGAFSRRLWSQAKVARQKNR